MSTRAQLRVLILGVLRDNAAETGAESAEFPNTFLNTTIESTRRIVYGRIADRLPDIVSSTGSMTYTAQAASMPLPTVTPNLADALSFSVVRSRGASSSSEGDYYELTQVRIEEALSYTRIGPPLYIAFQGNNAWVRPVPSIDLSLQFFYVAGLTDLADDAASPTEVKPAGLYQDLLVYESALALRDLAADAPPGITRRRDNIQRALFEQLRSRTLTSGLAGAGY